MFSQNHRQNPKIQLIKQSEIKKLILPNNFQLVVNEGTQKTKKSIKATL